MSAASRRRQGVERPIRLASNESALGPSPKAVAAYRALAGDIHRYPDGSAIELREALGRAHGLDPARIVCGSGSDELIGMLLRAYAGPGGEVLYSRHGFLMYPIGALSVGATPVAAPERDLTADVDALLERVTERTRIVFIANPNNPTGTYLPMSEMRAAACRTAAARRAGDRRRLCRVRQPQRFRARRRRWSTGPKTS